MLPTGYEDALVVQCVLHISEEALHEAHFLIRDAASDERRPTTRYLEHFGDIRRIQRYIVERARKLGVPVIENRDAERATAEVMELVVSAAERMRETV
jgi:2-phosphoglycerate kinase